MEKAFITIIIERNKFKKIYIDDIFYFKAKRSYSIVKTTEEEFLISKPLKDFETILEYEEFIKISKSFIINSKMCKEIKTGKNREIKLINNEVIKPNCSCLKHLKELFNIITQN